MNTDPLSRRLMLAAGLLSALLLAVVANALLHSEGNPLNPIATAAEKTRQVSGGKLKMRVTYSVPGLGRSFAARGNGVFNEDSGRARIVLDVPGAGWGTSRLVTVADETTAYIRMPEIARELPGGRAWLATQPWLGESEPAAIGGNGGARGNLDLLRSVGGEVASLGTETLRGATVERYQASVTIADFARLLAEDGQRRLARTYEKAAAEFPDPIGVEAWVWPDGIARKLRMVMTQETGGQVVRTDMTMEIFALGARPRIKLPPPGDVFDATPIVRAEMNLFDGRSLPRSGRPEQLALPVFQRRGNAICAGMMRSFGPIMGRIEAATARLEALGRAGIENVPPSRVGAAFERFGFEALEPTVRIGKRAMRRFGAIAPPPELAPTYERFLRGNARTLEVMEAEARAAELGELGLVDRLADLVDRIEKAPDPAARALGLDRCTADAGDADPGPGNGSPA